MRICQAGQEPRPAAPLVAAARARLQALGARAGQRVLVVDTHSEQLVVTLIALVLQDCSIVLADDTVDPTTLRHIVDTTQPNLLIGNLPKSIRHADDAPPSSWTLPECADAGMGDLPHGRAELGPWRDREDALILFTSGSSGRPKGVVRSGGAMLGNIWATGQAMRYRGDDVFLPLVPVSHQYGFSMALLAWAHAATFVVGNPSRAVDSLQRAARAQSVTVVDAAPAHYEALLQARIADPRFGADVRMWCVGGAPCSSHLKERVASAFGSPLLDGYGMTEMGNLALGTLEDPSGVGRVIDGAQVRIMDPQAPQRQCATGQPGRIWARSIHGFSRYLHEKTTRGPDDWFDTGDLGYFAADGSLHVVGRDGAVHRNGHTLHLAGLEGQLAAAGILAVLVPVPSLQDDTYLLAFVRGDEPKEMKRRIRQSLPQYAWPNRTVVLHRFELLPNGKIDRAALAASAHAHMPAKRHAMGA